MFHPNDYHNYNNHYYYKRRLAVTSSLVFLFQLLLSFIGFTADASEAGSCRLISPNPAYGSGLKCKLLFSDQSLQLDQCQPIEGGTVLKECSQFINATKSICKLQIEFTKLSPVKIQSLLDKTVCEDADNEEDELEVTVVLSSIKESGSNLILFPESRNITIHHLKIIDPVPKLFDTRFIGDNFHLTKRFEVSRFKFTNITPGTFILLRNSDKLEAIEIRDCSIQNVEADSFFFSRNFRTLKFINLKVTGQLKSAAIVLEDSNCKIPDGAKIDIQLENSDLSRSNLQNDFIKVDRLSQCQASIWVKISLLRNSFTRAIKREIFGTLIETLRNRVGVELEFKYDPIDCCLDTNRWLLIAVSAQHKDSTLNSNKSIYLHSNHLRYPNYLDSDHASSSQNIFDILCIDLGMKVDNFSKPNATKIDDICIERNDYPIMMIGIVSILLLAALLAVFSFICFFYVLPMRGNVIMYDNNRPGATHLSRDKPASSSVAEIRSSRTTNTGSPLMESFDSREISKSRRSATIKSPGRAIKSPGEQPKSPTSIRSVRSPVVSPPGLPPKLHLTPGTPSPPPSFGPKFKLPQKPYSNLVATKSRKSLEHKQATHKELLSPKRIPLLNLRKLFSGTRTKKSAKEPTANGKQPTAKGNHKNISQSPKSNKSLLTISAKKSSSAANKLEGGKRSSPVALKTATVGTEKASAPVKSPAKQATKDLGRQQQQNQENLGGVNKIVATKKPNQDDQEDDRLSLAFKTSG